MAVGPTRGLATFAEHDMAQHLAEAVLKDRFVYSAAFGWMRWDGKVWERQEDREGIAVKREIRRYLTAWAKKEVATLPPQMLAALVRHLAINGLDRLEKALKTIDGVTVHGSWFDREPLLLNTPSGVLDLEDGTLHPHSPHFGCTLITQASYIEGATHPDWEQALKALPDADTASWLQCYLGRGIRGDQDGVEQAAFMIGGGQNGKSVIIGSALEALGTYGAMVSDELLSVTAHEEHVMRLRGLRLAVVEELTDGHRLNTARLKKFLGTKKMTGRHLFQKPLEWEPSHTLVVTTNYMPVVTETDHGTWRRLVSVPFPHEFPLDPAFKARCQSDPDVQAAVLAWLVEGMRTPMPVVPSPAIMQSTADWRQSVDLIAQFMDECLEADDGATVERNTMLALFNDFTHRLGHRPMSGRTFTERFRTHRAVLDMGIEETKVRGVRMWQNVSVKAPTMGRMP